MATRHIVVGLDGSPGSEAAARWCAEMAPLLDAEVVAVHALPPVVYMLPTTPGAIPPVYDDTVRQELTRALDGWCAPLREADAEFRSEVVEGSPAEAIMRVADKVDADLIVVGRRGHGGFAELVLGSVPHQLSHHADRPVVVVPAG